MTGTLALGMALSTRPWRSALHRHCRDHEADVAVYLLREGRELDELALDVVLVDDDTSWLSAPFVTRARERGVSIVGVFDPAEADGYGLSHLARLGIDATVPATITTDELVDTIRARRPDRATVQQFGRLVNVESDRRPSDSRTVVAVGGPAGSGATEVSIALASLDGAGRSILVDADETHPGLARRLGLEVHPHILTAVDAHRGEQQSLDGSGPVSISDCLARPVLGQRSLPFDVIVGLTSRDDWSLLRPDDALDLVDELAARWSHVVVRLGPQLEDLSGHHVDRFGVSRALAARADAVVGVCDATPLGLLRFLDWLVDLAMVAGEAPIDVVLNRVPRRSRRWVEVEDQLTRIAGERIRSVVAAPVCRSVERAAWNGDVVTSSGLHKALAGCRR